MKRKIFILSAIAALCTLVAGCTDEVKSNQLDSLKLSNTYVSIDPAGGSNTVTVTATGPWQFVDDHGINAIPDWLTVEPTSGNAGTTTVTFTGTGSEAYRLAKLKIKIGDQEQYINVAQGTDAASSVKIAEALTGPDGRKLEITGAVTGWYSNAEQYGNFYLTDDSGTILVYGLADKDGKFKNYPLASWGIELGDVLTVVGPRGNYKGDPQMVDVTLVKLVKSLIQIVDVQEGNIAKEGGEKEIRLVCKGGGPTVTIPEADQAWLSVSDIRMIPGVPDPQFPTVAVPDTAVVTMKAVANAAGARTSTVAFGSTSGENSSSVSVEIVQEGSIIEVSIAEFLAAEVGQTLYRITGVVTELYTSDKQGESFYIADWSGKTLAYRAAGFKASGAKVGDIVTVVGQRGEYKGSPQIVSGTFEGIVHAVTEISVTDFLTKPDSKDVYYMVTGTITSLLGSNGKPNDYGNLYISDGTSTLYVFGTYPGYGATGDNRKYFIANTGIEVGDELTMIGYKDTYTDKNGVSTIELCGGIYFSHKKKN